MRLLIDTHILLWALADVDRIPAATRALIEDGSNEVLFSAASIWEIAIKNALRRPDFDAEPGLIAREAEASGFVELPVRAAAAARVAGMPLLHRDPFDRILVAQAMEEGCELHTVDPLLAPYSALVRLQA